MKIKRLGRLAAACLIASFPASLSAQTGGDAAITILQTTDLHHHANGAGHTGLDADPVTATSIVGAYSRISSYVNYVRANTGHPVLLVDSGDWTMGTLYDLTLSKDPLALRFLELMNYDCVTLGNHEFDYAPQGLATMLSAAQSSFGFHTPIVATNMNLGGSPDLAPFVGDGKLIQSLRIENLSNGLRVGYIGLMGKDAALSAPVTAPVSFIDVSANYALLQDLVDGMRNGMGVQVLIALSHSGTDATGTNGEDVELARHVRGIDVIASGHTHTPLASAHAVVSGGWITQIIDAGAYGTNVSRIDLTYHPATNSTTLDGSSNLAMTDEALASIAPGLAPDPAVAALVQAADQRLNTLLAPALKPLFTDYDTGNLAKGIYHPVATAAEDMTSNAKDAVPLPNGLGDLAADAVRDTPNRIIDQALAGAGRNPANLPGYDVTPYQVGLIATGVLRGSLQRGVPLTFADLYNVVPLGATPDTTQAFQAGYPMVSGYLELADLKTLCALQLVTQSTLAPADYYLNLSGVKYSLKPAESYIYFKYATAAAVLQSISLEAAGGSGSAKQALAALIAMARDSGLSVLIAYGANNPYAGALVKLNDTNPTAAQIIGNLLVVGEVATAAAKGTSNAIQLIVSKAVAAVGTVSGFAPDDRSNTGVTADLPEGSRVRVATDLFAVLALSAVQQQFGVSVTLYKSATGAETLSGAGLNDILANRINAAPAGTAFEELKEWMAFISFVGTTLKGDISPAYASTSDVSQFAGTGAAVQTRNVSYPVASIAQLSATLGSLTGAPVCALAGTPSIAAVTNAAYGADLRAGGTVLVWGTGFSSGGGNSIRLTRTETQDSMSLDAASGTYFWDLSPNQINATLPPGVVSGEWQLSVTNACGATSSPVPVTLR